MTPCEHRGSPIRQLDCHCGGLRQSYACNSPAASARECVVLPLNYRAVSLFGDLSACVHCVHRSLGGKPQAALPNASLIGGGMSAENLFAESYPRDRLLWSQDLPRASLRADVTESSPSVVQHGGARLMAYQSAGSGDRFWLARLGADWQIERTDPIVAPACDFSAAARGECRLFEDKGDLWLAYVGKDFRGDSTAILARITDRGEVLSQWPIFWPNGNREQINWTFFSHYGRLIALPKLNPLIGLLLTNGNAAPHTASRWTSNWNWGSIEGGAPPVKVGDRWYCWFTSRVNIRGEWVASLGLLCFEDREPFKVVKCSHRPLYCPSPAEREKPYDPLSTIASGAVYATNSWVVSLTVAGRILRLIAFDAAEIEQELIPIGE